MERGIYGGYRMLRKIKLQLLSGCVAMCMLCTPVYAVSLEDSMLKPSAASRKEDTSDAKAASSFSTGQGTITTAIELIDLPQEERIQRIGELCRADYEKTGVLASVSAAQCILESGYLTTELATEANNCFGMKASLSGNNWENSTWDGESLYTKRTGEEFGGRKVTIVADFREYDSIEDSVADHSAYLLGATVGGGKLRYEGLEGETDYEKAIQIIRDGGYATDSSYVQKVCSIIERFDLTRFDEITEDLSHTEETAKKPVGEGPYRVRKSWEDAASQIGAYTILENARKACKDGYQVFDSQGNVIR